MILTTAIHALIVIIIAHEWRWPARRLDTDDAITIIRFPLAPDRQAPKPVLGEGQRKVALRPKAHAASRPRVGLPSLTPVMGAISTSEPDIAHGGARDAPDTVAQLYRRAVTARLQSERRYPLGALMDAVQGNGAVLFRIDRAGRLLVVTVEASTGNVDLDHAAVALVKRAAPFPRIPAELPDELEIALPIRFIVESLSS